MHNDACEILNSRISLLDCQEVVAQMRALIGQKQRTYVCVSNVHTTVMGWQDKEFREITNRAGIATADGVPLLWASRALGPAIHGRASGPDIMAKFFEEDSDRHYRHYLFGSTPETLERLSAAIQNRWPGTKIVGQFSPPFGDPNEDERQSHLNRINESGADIVWVGLGAPKQERWMAKNRDSLKPPILIGVGAAFDFLSGNKPRAPIWMQNAGLEWAHRLMSEPRRLFSRYAVTNTLFVAGVTAQIVRSKLSR